MQYFFILGNNPAVSAAEIMAVADEFSLTVGEMSRQVLLADSPKNIDESALMARLGGTVKLGRVIDQPISSGVDSLAKLMADQIQQGGAAGKNRFGFSVYSLDAQNPDVVANKAATKLYRSGMETKRLLKEAGLSARWIKPATGATLTSVVVEKEGLTKNGLEFVVLLKSGGLRVGVTSAVQPFSQFSKIDFGRPERDAYRGMLPPKVARMMLNIAGVNPKTTLWDPFCGSGTVLTEALQLGLTNIFGSDLSRDAVADTEDNIAWLKKQGFAPKNIDVCTFVGDARERPELIAAASVEAIVSEPYLGTPRRGRETRSELLEQLDELSDLYRAALTNWRKSLKDDAHIILALPCYIMGAERLGLDAKWIAGNGYRVEPTVPTEAAAFFGTDVTKNHGVIYGRTGQLVWREIVCLRPR
ncbi:MAG: hypothetical protein V1738_03175 [Patescibacteria group bacterium]